MRTRALLASLASSLFLSTFFATAHAQGTVLSEQKVSDTEGNFAPILDNGDAFGTSLTFLGDLDGDGNGDVVVGATGDDDGGSNTGAVWVVFLGDDGMVDGQQKISDTLGLFSGIIDPEDSFGFSVAAIGDLDGDSVEDIVVGATGDDDGGVARGAVWVLFLNSTGTVSSFQKISDTQGGFTGVLDDADIFGSAVAGLGDLDGDGIEDIAVGAQFDDDGGTNRGAVWILFLDTDGTVKSSQKISDTAGSFTGVLDDQDFFGRSIASLGDLDGDGVGDIAVGASGDDDGGTDRGAVWVLALNTNGTVKLHQKISDTDGSFMGTLANSDAFGTSVAALGDIDGDSVNDIAVGATGDDDGGSARGATWILFLNSNATVDGEQKISDTEGFFDGVLDNNDAFGSAITSLGDLDGDGDEDIAVGTPQDDDGGTNRGAFWNLFVTSSPATPPVANFTASPTSGVAPLSVTFTDTSTGDITSWTWNFGDSSTSTTQSPGHSYTSVGTYTVSLTTVGPGGSDTNTMTDLIVVVDPAPVADFSATPTTGANPLAVTFTDESTGTITSYAWTFGDGGTSSATDPMHTYTAIGTYTVSLTTTGPGGSDTNTMTDLITVTEPPPIANFSASPTSGVHPLAVTFTDTSTGGPITTYAWTFGDGGTSSASDPMHTYTAAGTYTVSLTATGPGGADTNTMTDLITVSEQPPVPDFSASPTSGVYPLNVTFTDTSTGGPITTYAWTFGDGGTSSASDPMHTYTAAGTYTVSLTATGPGGSDTNTMTDLITVGEPPPVASFTASPTSGPAPLDVTFTDTSRGGPITTYAWTFGDGGTSSVADPMHTYASDGTYTVSLTVTGPGGSDTSTQTDLIFVAPPPVADFSATPTSGAVPLLVSFTDASTGGPITTYAWDFGDGGTSTDMSPDYTYPTAGTYTVSLTVTGPGGSDTNTMTDLVTVTGTNFHVELDGDQMVPPVSTSGTGTASFALDPISKTVTASGTYTDLNDVQISISVRRAPTGEIGPAVYTLTGTGGTSGSFSGSAVLTDEEIDDLLAGRHYVLVHTPSEPLGEIRGQICRFASATMRNAGSNPLSYTAIPPVIGTSFTGIVNLTTTGHSLAVLLGYQSTLTFTLGSGATILVNISDPGGELFGFGIQPGPLAAFTQMVPMDLSVCSFVVYTQAVHIGGVMPFALSNAQDLVIGY